MDERGRVAVRVGRRCNLAKTVVLEAGSVAKRILNEEEISIRVVREGRGFALGLVDVRRSFAASYVNAERSPSGSVRLVTLPCPS